jgi:hypothetical protein
MKAQALMHSRMTLTAAASVAELAHVLWEHFHGGVLRHHILNRADLPSISNWWGLILIPVLAWFLIGRVQQRLALRSIGQGPASALIGFFGAMAFGAALALAFASGQENIAGYVMMSILALAVLAPIYRAECLLGFVLAMTFTFGAILPTIIGSVIAAISATLHRLIYPFLLRVWRRLRGT